MTTKLFQLTIFTTIFLAKSALGSPSGTLLQEENFVYKGAFRVPDIQSLAFGGSGLTFNQNNNSLLIFGRDKKTIEISIPATISSSSNISDLAYATVLRGPIDLTGGLWDDLKADGGAVGNGGSPGGMLVYNNKIIGSAFAYYDAGYQAARSHFSASINWDTAGINFSGFKQVGINVISATAVNGGYVGGYMTLVPTEWQTALGGVALTGKGAIPIITRTSLGPCAWSFNPDDIGTKEPVPATMLVGYPPNHPTLGTYSTSSQPSLYFNMGTQIGGIVFPKGSRTVLFYGRHGLGATGKGDTCYGPASGSTAETGNLSTNLPPNNTCDGQAMTGPDPCCYDPTDSSKGTHAYPYVYRVWAYDAQELANVKSGNINQQTGSTYKPWDIRPYAIWNLDFPLAIKNNGNISGAAYDPTTSQIFIVDPKGDKHGLDTFPLIHVYQVNIAPLSTPIINKVLIN